MSSFTFFLFPPIFSLIFYSTISTYVSTFGVANLVSPSNFRSGYFYLLLSSSMSSNGSSYTCVGAHLVPVVIFSLAASVVPHCASLNSSSTRYIPGVICLISFLFLVSLPLTLYVVSLLCQLNLYIILTLRKSIFKGSLLLLSSSTIFPQCSIFEFLP